MVFSGDENAEDEVRKLVGAGANLKQTDYRGNTVAHAACRTGSHKLRKFFFFTKLENKGENTKSSGLSLL